MGKPGETLAEMTRQDDGRPWWDDPTFLPHTQENLPRISTQFTPKSISIFPYFRHQLFLGPPVKSARKNAKHKAPAKAQPNTKRTQSNTQ